jgi:uncharacterized protein YerC
MLRWDFWPDSAMLGRKEELWGWEFLSYVETILEPGERIVHRAHIAPMRLDVARHGRRGDRRRILGQHIAQSGACLNRARRCLRYWASLYQFSQSRRLNSP